jgi:hypothetical protein
MLDKDQYVAVWRLDGNIHPFWQFERRITSGIAAEEKPLSLSLRPNFRQTLEHLSKEYNFVHVVHSDYWDRAMELALEKTNLKQHFKLIADKHEYNTKEYAWPQRYFIDQLGLTESEAQDRMIVLGSASYDHHTDVPGVVYLNQDQSPDLTFRSDTAYVGQRVLELLKDGEGSFNKGFAKWYEKGSQREEEERNLKIVPIRRFYFSNKMFAFLSYHPLTMNTHLDRDIPSSSIPTIELQPYRPRTIVETFIV